jgi:hypothetical protein
LLAFQVRIDKLFIRTNSSDPQDYSEPPPT